MIDPFVVLGLGIVIFLFIVCADMLIFRAVRNRNKRQGSGLSGVKPRSRVTKHAKSKTRA